MWDNVHTQSFDVVPSSTQRLTLMPFLCVFQASKPEHAVIRVWDSENWRQVATLPHHSLTVTQLAFSHSGEYLLAVSRDRCWSLWKQSHDEGKLGRGRRVRGRAIENYFLLHTHHSFVQVSGTH